ncbi:MAG: Flp family type IVb pilin [Clostridia bacterium]
MLKQFLRDESGQGMVEYGLIIALVAIGVIIALTAMSGKIKDIFTKTAEKLTVQ